MTDKSRIEIYGNSAEFDIIEGTEGLKAIDESSLSKTLKALSYDPGFFSTAACSSAITYIDGEQGILRYRGYDITSLVGYDFLSIVYLLFYGEMPNKEQEASFKSKVQSAGSIPEQVRNNVLSFSPEAHPMAILMSSFASLAAFYHQECEKDLKDENFDFGIKAIAHVSELVALVYRHTSGLGLFESDAYSLHDSYANKFVKMMFNNPSSEEIISKALNIIFVLHADHEQNASTATVRLSGSAGANLFACIGAGIATLWGPAHGGANEAVIKMLKQINDIKAIPDYISQVKENKDNVKLMGFGHRVYKNYDPRAKIMRQTCQAVLGDLGMHNDSLLEIAMELEKIALQDSYFIERKLYPNVDFYSGIILRAIGVPTNMFTCLFALARTSGWVAQWHEMMNEGVNKIWRPRQIYIGKPHRDIQGA